MESVAWVRLIGGFVKSLTDEIAVAPGSECGHSPLEPVSGRYRLGG